MINAHGSLEYLKDRLIQLENFKEMVVRGDTKGWGESFTTWSIEQEEKLELLKELIKYRELYYKVEKQLEEMQKWG